MAKLKVTPEEYVEVLNLYSAYNLSSDAGEADWYASLFTEDGELHGTYDVKGRTALAEYKKRDKAGRTHVYRRHWNGSIHLEKLDADTIRGRCYLFGYNGEPGKLPYTTHAGVYTDIVKRVDGEWKFAERRLAFDGVLEVSAAPEYAGVAELLALYRGRQVSPVEVTKALIARAERHEASLHCFVTRTAELALEQARAAEAAWLRGAPTGPLCGVPYGLKDVIETAGVRTTGQSKILQHHVPARDAGVAAKMRAAGGALLGKLTTYEFAHGGPSWDLPWPPAMNPWKPGYLPGSTSSGAGAALAAGIVPAAIGTDTGGSIRMPAAVCGIVGVKPTYGLVSRRGVLPNTFTFDTCGPMARSVEDAAIMLNAIAGYDDEDVASAEHAPEDYTRDLARGVRGLRIGWVRHWYEGDPGCHPDIPPAMDAALRQFESQGAIVEEIRLSDLLVYQDCKTTISITEMFSAWEHEFRTRPQDFGLMFRNKVLAGSLIRAEDYFQALRQRLALARELTRAFRAFDLLASPGWMTPAEPARPGKLDKFLRPPNITTPFNIGGQPAMCLPCGFSADGLPLSLQLAARHFDEATLFRAGHAYQQATDWHRRRPPEEGLLQ